MRVVDVETGAGCGRLGKEQESFGVRGFNVFMGYRGSQQSAEESFVEDQEGGSEVDFGSSMLFRRVRQARY